MAFIALAAYDYEKVITIFESFNSWVAIDPVSSFAAIFFAYIVLVMIAFPIMYPTIALGFSLTLAFNANSSFALIAGLVILTVSIVIGGIGAFELSRHWLSKTIKNKCLANHRSFIAINHVITRDGWKTVLLLRLTPFPYSLVSYMLGITNLKIKDFICGSLIVSVHIAVWLWIGKSLTNFTELSSSSTEN